MAKLEWFSLILVIFKIGSTHCSTTTRFQIEPPLPSFQSREEYITKLYDSIKTSQSARNESLPCHHINFITGPSGIGKTQLVRKYIEKYGPPYDHLIWLNVDDSSNSISSSFLTLASSGQFISLFDQKILKNLRKLDYSHAGSLNATIITTQIVQKIYTHIKNSSTLLVFDNVPTDQDESGQNEFHLYLQQLQSLPQPEKLVILIISRDFDSEWENFCRDDLHVFEIGGWTGTEQINYLLDNVGFQNGSLKDDAAREDAQELGSILDGHPLAIQLAAAFINTTKKSMNDYTQLYNDQITGDAEMDPLSGVWFMTRHELEDSDAGTLALEMTEILSLLPSFCDDKDASDNRGILRTVLNKLMHLQNYSKVHDGANLFLSSIYTMEKYKLIRRTRLGILETDDDLIQCERILATTVKDSMRQKRRTRIQTSIARGINKYLKQIIEKDGYLSVGSFSNFIRKFLDFQPIIRGGGGQGQLDNLTIAFMYQRLKLALKLGIVYEKIGDFSKEEQLIQNFSWGLKSLMGIEQEGKEFKKWISIFDYLSKFLLTDKEIGIKKAAAAKKKKEMEKEKRERRRRLGIMDEDDYGHRDYDEPPFPRDPDYPLDSEQEKKKLEEEEESKKKEEEKEGESNVPRTRILIRTFLQKLLEGSEQIFGKEHLVIFLLKDRLTGYFEKEEAWSQALRVLRSICPQRDKELGKVITKDDGQLEMNESCKKKERRLHVKGNIPLVDKDEL